MKNQKCLIQILNVFYAYNINCHLTFINALHSDIVLVSFVQFRIFFWCIWLPSEIYGQ